MLFMSIFTYEPAQKHDVLSKRMEGFNVPEGAKLINQWSSASGGCAFTLFETDSSFAIAQWCAEWNDLGDFDIIPVIESEELMDALRAKMK